MAENDDDMRNIFAMDEAFDYLSATGFRKPIVNLTTNDVKELKSALLDYHLMVKVKAELDQYCDGLKTFNFWV